MTTEAASSADWVRRRYPIVRFLSSIWLGIALLGLIIVYSSIISALPPVRWALEMTETQAFRHWLFVALVILFALSLLTATLFRTRWIAINVGALVTHIGLLLLTGGALAHFGAKVEGSILLQSPAIQLRAAIGDNSTIFGQFRAVPGEAWQRRLPHTGEALRISVLKTTAVDGNPAATARIRVESGADPPRTITLNAGDPDWHPLDPILSVRLVGVPAQSFFYDNERPALYFRNLDTGHTTIANIDGLPIYHDHLPADVVLLDSQGAQVTPARPRPELRLGPLAIPTGWFERWQMPIDVDTPNLPFTLKITAYAPYVAALQPRPLAGGSVSSEPVLAARRERRPDIAVRAMSAIQLEIHGRGEHANWSETRWCLFSLYPDIDPRPLEISLPGLENRWELIYSRARHDLGATLAATNLYVKYFPGMRSIESYHSDVIIQPKAGTPLAATVETNRTYQVGQWTLFQSGFAEDQWSYSILGVGNRVGMLPMNLGWVSITLGCLYAFYVKPVLLRRARRKGGPVVAGRSRRPGAARIGAVAGALLPLLVLAGCGKAKPLEESERAAALDRQIDWSGAKLIAVQDGSRYKTLDSFARESFATMTGREHLPGLSPPASLLEWLFNRDAYADAPVIKVRNAGIRARLTRHMTKAKQERIAKSKRLTPNELAGPSVQRALAQLESRPLTRRAVNRVRNAQAIANHLDRFLAIVPQPGGDRVAPWFTPIEILANLSDGQLARLGLARSALPPEAQTPVAGVTPDDALVLTVSWSSLRAAWLRGDAAGVQRQLDRLGPQLRAMDTAGSYPAPSQLRAEARYYAAGKFTYGWLLYFVAFVVSIFSLVTGWRGPWWVTLALLVAALGIHVYGVSLRWYILGRIPVANMFEAVVGSAALGIALVLLVELFLRSRVLLVGAGGLGFAALVGAQYVLPGSELGVIPGILDDIQLRVHTVLIIWAYALIFVAAIVGVIYLIGYYFGRTWGTAHAGPAPAGGGNPGAPGIVTSQRPLLAGGTPGDESGAETLPAWLNNIDWAHLIIINILFVFLFVGGIVLGAWWADYSWGRPWGWDPKEVFALNTWLIYAVLLHTRFVVQRRGLWTAWLSIAGCIMMCFNWFFVNFFIASVHSYV